MEKVKNWISKEVKESGTLFRSVPGLVLALFILSTVLMNILASVAIVNESWVALDAGILVSFIGFLLADMIVKRFGTKAAIRTTVLALAVNIVVCSLFAAVAGIANATGGWFALADYATATQWWIIAASATAFLLSGVIDSLIHTAIRKAFKKNPDGIVAHAASSWGSTFVGQFLDNLVFALIFTLPASFAGLWGMTPMAIGGLFGFALAGAVVELICQAVFTPIGFKIAERWRKQDVGKEYLDLIAKEKTEGNTI